jgi:hypothetical protein
MLAPALTQATASCHPPDDPEYGTSHRYCEAFLALNGRADAYTALDPLI